MSCWGFVNGVHFQTANLRALIFLPKPSPKTPTPELIDHPLQIWYMITVLEPNGVAHILCWKCSWRPITGCHGSLQESYEVPVPVTHKCHQCGRPHPKCKQQPPPPKKKTNRCCVMSLCVSGSRGRCQLRWIPAIILLIWCSYGYPSRKNVKTGVYPGDCVLFLCGWLQVSTPTW